MGSLANAMTNITQDLASSTTARLQRIEQLRVETSGLLTDAQHLVSQFHTEHEEQAAALRHTLNEFKQALDKEVQHTLEHFHKEHRQRTKELRQALTQFMTTLQDEVKQTLDEFRNTTLAENAADCHQAHEVWMGRPNGRSATRTPAKAEASQPKPARAKRKNKRK